MLAYAAGRRRIAERQSSPNAMLVVLCGHILVVAAVMSARMTLPPRIVDPPTTIVSVPLPKDPPPAESPNTHTPHTVTNSTQTHEQTEVVPTVTDRDVPIDLGAGSGLASLGGTATFPKLPLPPPSLPVSTTAKLLTPPSEVKPPYPQSKLLAGEEAALTLRLTVDEHGRVAAVDPVGRVDPVFLAAARRHLMGHWRYKPATEDGRAVSSTIVVTLRFELDG